MALTLDVGCGATPQGDVNVDLYPHDRTQCANPWNPKTTPNFILADAENLPFKDKAFTQLTSYGTLEHVLNPFKALTEFHRVAEKVTLTVPSAYNQDKSSTHLWTWNPLSLNNLLCKIFTQVEIRYTERRGESLEPCVVNLNPCWNQALYFPIEIEANCE